MNDETFKTFEQIAAISGYVSVRSDDVGNDIVGTAGISDYGSGTNDGLSDDISKAGSAVIGGILDTSDSVSDTISSGDALLSQVQSETLSDASSYEVLQALDIKLTVVIFLLLFFWCHHHLRNAVRSFTGRNIDK